MLKLLLKLKRLEENSWGFVFFEIGLILFVFIGYLVFLANYE